MTPMPGARIPHMGWNTLRATGDAEPLLEGIDDGATAYFVHGYAAPVSFDSVAIAAHGEPFCAVVRSRLYCGVQFHPERSGAAGSRLLANFLRWMPCAMPRASRSIRRSTCAAAGGFGRRRATTPARPATATNRWTWLGTTAGPGRVGSLACSSPRHAQVA